MDAHVIDTSTLLVALLVPLLGAIGVMLKGDNENVREAISSVSSILLLIIVLWLSQDVFKGKTLYYNLFTILPNLTITLRKIG